VSALIQPSFSLPSAFLYPQQPASLKPEPLVLRKPAGCDYTPWRQFPARGNAACAHTGTMPATLLRFDSRFPKETVMLHYAIVFFVIALIAALFGFTGLAAGAAGIAKILFVVFLVLAIGGFLLSVFRKSN